MGAESFVHENEGRSAEECFRELVEDANVNYGTQSYNGSINTCSMGRKTLSLAKLNDTNMDKAYKHIDKNDNGEKWEARYIEIGPIGFDVFTFKKVHTGEKPKYEMMFSVKKDYFKPKKIKSFKTKKEADDYAIKLSIQNPDTPYVVDKEYVLVEGDPTTTRIEQVKKRYASKPNLKPMPNRVIVPIYKYLFYGWASC